MDVVLFPPKNAKPSASIWMRCFVGSPLLVFKGINMNSPCSFNTTTSTTLGRGTHHPHTPTPTPRPQHTHTHTHTPTSRPTFLGRPFEWQITSVGTFFGQSTEEEAGNWNPPQNLPNPPPTPPPNPTHPPPPHPPLARVNPSRWTQSQSAERSSPSEGWERRGATRKRPLG